MPEKILLTVKKKRQSEMTYATRMKIHMKLQRGRPVVVRRGYDGPIYAAVDHVSFMMRVDLPNGF